MDGGGRKKGPRDFPVLSCVLSSVLAFDLRALLLFLWAPPLLEAKIAWTGFLGFGIFNVMVAWTVFTGGLLHGFCGDEFDDGVFLERM